MIRQAATLSSLVILLSGAAVPASAGEQLAGAFGVRLGEPFNPGLVVSRETDGNHFDYYLVDPPLIAPELQHYGIYVTPHSHVIYRIAASGRFPDLSACGAALNTVVGKLSQYHGEPARRDHSVTGPVRFAAGERTLVVECLLAGGWTDLRVTFNDARLAGEGGG